MWWTFGYSWHGHPQPAVTGRPLGIMALWPLASDYYQVSNPIFDSVWRHNVTPGFWSHNIRAVAKELVMLVPCAWVGFWLARRRASAQYL